MIIWEGVQGSPAWFEKHRGIATASDFDRIITPKQMKPSAGIDELICQKIGELATLGSIEPEGYISKPMIAGTLLEPEARRYYELTKDVDVRQVGMVFTDDMRFGCSPDFLVGDDGVGELKCPLVRTHIKYLLDGKLPDCYLPQCHGHLIVTGRAYCDFMSYAESMDPLIVRVTPDDFTDALRKCFEEYDRRFREALAKIRLPQRNP